MILMPMRPFRCYRRLEPRPYARRDFVKGVPGSKIVTFDMGGRIEKFPVKVTLYAAEGVQIRHNALEASRVMANRYLLKALGKYDYHLKVQTVPHHILRENAMATGAGADRYQTGMRESFGRPIGYAARVKRGQPIMTVWVYSGREKEAREALRRAKMKLPMKCRMGVEYVQVDTSRLARIAELERLESEREARRAAEEAAKAEAAAKMAVEAAEGGKVEENKEAEAGKRARASKEEA